MRPSIVATVTLALTLSTGAAGAHEERMAVGRVQAIEPARGLMVLADLEGGRRLTLQVTPETEVTACRTTVGLAAVPLGAMVRVNYLDKAGEESRVRSVLLLGETGRRPRRPPGR